MNIHYHWIATPTLAMTIERQLRLLVILLLLCTFNNVYTSNEQPAIDEKNFIANLVTTEAQKYLAAIPAPNPEPRYQLTPERLCLFIKERLTNAHVCLLKPKALTTAWTTEIQYDTHPTSPYRMERDPQERALVFYRKTIEKAMTSVLHIKTHCYVCELDSSTEDDNGDLTEYDWSYKEQLRAVTREEFKIICDIECPKVEQDTLKLHIKRDFSRAVLDLLRQQDTSVAADEHISLENMIKARAQQYLESIDIVNEHALFRADILEFAQIRHTNAQNCLSTNDSTQAHQDELVYSNHVHFINQKEVETDLTKRAFYFYETFAQECGENAISIHKAEYADCEYQERWKKQDALELTAKRDFAQAILDLLNQQDTQEAQ